MQAATDALTQLPETERAAWQQLWADVEALLARVRAAKEPRGVFLNVVDSGMKKGGVL